MNPALPNQLIGVQALRGLAAMLVVLAHATQMVHERFKAGDTLHFGAAGVDIFFPISGFVMVVTTQAGWGRSGQAVDFLARRLVRIVPLYWAATTLKLVATLALPGLTSHPVLDTWHVIASFLFIPAFDADHKPLPLLPVGWTLNFEMLFYLLFAAALALRLRPVLWTSLVLLALALLPLPGWVGPFATWGEPIMAEFIGGMLVGWATMRGFRLPVRVAACCLPLSLAALLLSQQVPEQLALAHRVGLWGAPGVLTLLSVIALEAPCRRWLSGLPAQLGDASYAIYLMHGFVAPAVGVACLKLHLTSQPWRWLAVLAACAASAAAGVVVHRLFERPLTRFLGSFRRRQRDHAAANPAP